MIAGSPRSPRVVLISGLSIVSESELFARIARVASLPPEARAGLVVHLREPDRDGGALLDLAMRLREATSAVGGSLWVNDRIDVALAASADGVHLGRRSVSIADARALMGSTAAISVACHAVDDVRRAAEQGANAVTLSPIFASPGKGEPLGLDALREARAALDASPLGRAVTLTALGGIDLDRAKSCFEAGADAVAAIRADLTPSLAREGSE